MAEHWRQALHLDAPTGWLNDPNGLCCVDGVYHVYFQSCPDTADGSGQKCWGHFESSDLCRWHYTGTVLRPDTPHDRSGVYSGCAVVTGDGEINLFYTGNVKEQGDYDYITAGRGANVLRVVTRDGVTMSEKQLLLTNADYPAWCSCHVRDPKIEPLGAGGWRMVLGARSLDDKGCVLVYHSEDLVHWAYRGVLKTTEPFGYMWECPDLFCLDGENILSASPQGLPHEAERWQNVYQSGWFPLRGDGVPKAEEFAEWDMGFDFYAPQSFVTGDGRRMLIGWMGLPDAPYENATTAHGWQHCLSVPREVFRDAEGRVCQRPAAELDALRGEGKPLADGEAVRVSLPAEVRADGLTGNFTLTVAEHLQLRRRGEVCTLEFSDAALGGGRTVRNARLPRCRDLRVLLDTSSLECYLDGGAAVFATRFYPAEGPVSVKLEGTAGELTALRPMEVIYDAKA